MMMKSLFSRFVPLLLAAGLASCADDLAVPAPSTEPGKSGFSITLAFPEMPDASTRALGEPAPSLTELDLFLFVFDGNNLLQTIRIPAADTDWADNGGAAANRVKFTAFLPQTDDLATVHIVATSDGDGLAAQIDRTGYGLEDIVMPAYAVSGTQDVYWQRVELGCRILVSVNNNSDPDLDSVEGTEKKVQAIFDNPIPLIRNFAKVSLRSGTDNLTVRGWTIVNDLDGSSVVPWYSPAGISEVFFPQYADFSKTPADIFDYDAITGQGYAGVSLAGADKRNTLDEVSKTGGAAWGTDPRYIYERKAVSVEPLYILLYGEYNGGSTPKAGYYKLALGRRDGETGLFTEYNVLRNIAYEVVITDASAPGYDTPEEAAAAPAFNNVSGDVTTRNMTQISDGVDMLYVNFVNYVVTLPGQEIDFRFRYLEDITGSRTVNNGAVVYDAPGIGIADGAVVKSWSGATDVTDDHGNSWKSIKIQADDPSDELKQQTFTIYSPPGAAGTGTLGLSRTINLILRNPWNYVRVETYPGLWEDHTQFPAYDPDDTPDDPDVNYFVGAEMGAPLTLFFELPAGLPEAMFPLDFQIESDRQNIENAGVGNAVVQTGPSLFPGVTDSRISFVKTVNWGDYAPDGVSSTPASRIVRARFVTTTNIESLYDDAYISTLKLHNPYFVDEEDKFMRQQPNVDDPNVPMPADLIWNFSDDVWDGKDSSGNDLLPGAAPGTRYYTRSYAGLSISQNETANTTAAQSRRMTSGLDNEGDRYIATRRSADKFTFTVSIPRKTKAQLKITADADNPDSSVDISASVTPSTVLIESYDNEEFKEKRTRTYTIIVLQGGATFTVSLSPKSNYDNNAIRIYKIEFYPEGEPQSTDGN